jgi:hypothetical protein
VNHKPRDKLIITNFFNDINEMKVLTHIKHIEKFMNKLFNLKFFSMILLLHICSTCLGEQNSMPQIDIQVKITAPIIKVGGLFPVGITLTNSNTENKLVEVSQDSHFEFRLKSQKYGTFVISEALYDNATYIYGDSPQLETPRKALLPGESITYPVDISRWYVRILPADDYQLIVHYTGLNGEQISSQPISVKIHGIINQKPNHTANLDLILKVANSINLAESFPAEITLKNKDSNNNSVDVDTVGEGVLFEFELYSKDRGKFIISKALSEGDSNPYKNPEFKWDLKSLQSGESINYKMDIKQWQKSYIPGGKYRLIVYYTAPSGKQYSSNTLVVQITN